MNKCDGIKILELDPKRILEGNEYMVIAEKDQNFKAPINQIVDLVVSDDRLKNYIDTTIESSIGDFKNEVNQSISELTSKINNLDSKITNVNNRITNLESSIDDIEHGYVTFNGKQYKTWNDQTNVDGGIIIGSVRCLNTDTMTEEGQIKVIAMNENGTIYNDSISTAFRYGYVAGNSEKRGQQFIRSYVSSRDGQAADEEFAVVNYFDKTEAGQVVALNPIT